MKKQILGVLLCLALVLSFAPQTAFAADEIARGTCGDNITWTLDDEGTLTIDGWGEMNAYPNYCAEKYIQEIKKAVISGGITNIGEAA
ncbi:MAG: hypothetical protein MJ128_05680, partial [Mogibacterium sp.]|nr:hypothetical protein [Mogibacterium sp.]